MLRKEQKAAKPSAEDIIPGILDGDMKERALKFAAYMRENNMPFKMHTTMPGSQSANYKGKVICGMLVFPAAAPQIPGCRRITGSPSWAVEPSLAHMGDYEEQIINEGLQHIIWDNAFRCVWSDNYWFTGEKRGCRPDKPCAGGQIVTVLGNEIRNVCKYRSNPVCCAVCNPSEAEIAAIKRLLELERKARDENKA